MVNGEPGMCGGGCGWSQAKVPAPPVTSHTEGNLQQGRGCQAGGNGRPLGPFPLAFRLQSPDGEWETGSGWQQGTGPVAGSWEDGPDCRPGLGTVPRHEFRVPGL